MSLIELSNIPPAVIVHIVMMATAGAFVASWGNYRHKRAWGVLMLRWALVFGWVYHLPPMSALAAVTIMHSILAFTFWRLSVTDHGDTIGVGFAVLVILGGLAGILHMAGAGWISIELNSGRGIFALTFWNIQGWVMLGIEATLINACLASRSGAGR